MLFVRRFVGLAIVACTACHKPAPEPEAVPLPAELKSYTLFEPGTYWIYQDSATQQLDSVWVVDSKKEVFRLGGNSSSKPLTMKFERFTSRVHSSVSNIQHLYRIDRQCGLPYQQNQDARGSCWVLERGRYQPTSTTDAGEEQVFPYSIDRDKTIFLLANSAVMYPYWYSQPVLLNGTSYDNVMEVKLTTDASEAGWPTHYYWVPNKGIVLQRIKRNGRMQTWQLLRSHIVQ